MSDKSIYARIKKYILQFGKLPDDFVVEEKEHKKNEIRFAPGALEGILGHHMSGESTDKDFAQKIKEYLSMSPEDAMDLFEKEVAPNFKTASIRQALQTNIYEHREEYDANKLAGLAVYFAEYGTKAETVKLGLSLLVLFDMEHNPTVCEMLTQLGYCEEFTDYVIMNTRSWEEDKKQQLYFELAKILKGWGKITVVEMMKADTKEKKDWLLTYGCQNSVMYAYLGYECAMKCDLYERLQKGDFSDEEFRGASDIMSGLLDEGPCQGMSALEYPAELSLLYLEECKKHNWDAEQVALITDIAVYFQDSELENAREVTAKAKEIIEMIDIHTFIVEHVEQNTHECMRIAKIYEIDMSEHLIRLMKMDFEKYYGFCYYLFTTNQKVDEFLALCDREIVYDTYPNQMGNDLGLGPVPGNIKLDTIVQYMDRHCGKGCKMIRACIQSPITRWRNMAAGAMLGWVKEANKTLQELDAGLYAEVVRVSEIECSNQTKGMWEKLL